MPRAVMGKVGKTLALPTAEPRSTTLWKEPITGAIVLGGLAGVKIPCDGIGADFKAVP
jgi:hypothetical protein